MRSVMRLSCLLGAVLGCVGPTFAQDDPNLIAPTEALSPEEQRKMFHLPPGFSIELVVAEPDIGQPTNITFDAAGRLWINSSLEYPYPVKEGGRDALRYMVDTDKNGVPDQIHVYADGLNIPIGVAPVKDAVLCYSIPNIYRFVDTNGDGKADERTIAYSEFGFADTHGMASSFRPWLDGWVYACHGFANNSTIEGSDKHPIKLNSGNTYRIREDGSHIEQWTWGQVNPYGLAFDAWGNMYSSDCHTKPAYQLLRGAYYPSFGKPHDGLGFGPEMIDHLHGSTGIAGIVIYDAPHLPTEFQGNLFIGNPVTGRVNRDRLEWKGTSPNAVEMPDFISCDDRWFRPVDVAVAPDGSLYIADFYNCIIGHYEVRLDHPRRDRAHGRIWRVTYTGTPEVPAPEYKSIADLTQLDGAALIAALGDANFNTRILAARQLVDRIGPSAASPVREMLATSKDPNQKSNGLWVVERLGGLSDDEVRALVHDSSPVVRTHLVRALGERAEWGKGSIDERKLLIDLLANDESPFVRRSSAEALGIHPDDANIEPLLNAWRAAPAEDTHLIHVVRIALRNNLRDLGKINEQAVALGNDLDVRNRFADVVVGAATPSAGEFLLAHLATPDYDHNRRHEFFHHAARYLDPARLPELYALARKQSEGDIGSATDLLRALFNASQERGQPLADTERDWACEVANQLLDSSDTNTCKAGIDFARDLKLKPTVDRLLALAKRDSRLPEHRMVAIEAIGQIDVGQATAFLRALVPDGTEDPAIRLPAAELLGKLKDNSGIPILAELLRVAPADFAVFLARGLSWTDGGGDALVRMIEEGKAAAELLNDNVVSWELKFRKVPDKENRIRALVATIPSPDEAVRKLMDERRGSYAAGTGDVAKGEAIFTKNCGICHQVAGKGAKIGPQLDGVGIRGLDRLLEDTLDPDRNVDQAFRKVTLLRNDGGVVSGLILRREGAVTVLADAQGKEVRIADDDIDEKQESKLSPMPSDVARMLSAEDFHHLMAFLLSQRQEK